MDEKLPTITGRLDEHDILRISFDPELPISCQQYFLERTADLYAGNIKTDEIETIIYYIQRLIHRAYDMEILYYNPIKNKWGWDPLKEIPPTTETTKLFYGTFE